MRYDITFVGHMCVDEINLHDGTQRVSPGSAVLCGAVAAARIGMKVAAVVKMSPADSGILGELRDAGVGIFIIPAAETTYSQVTHRSADVDVRSIAIKKSAGLIRLDEVPEIDTACMHLAGISDQEFDMTLMKGLAAKGYSLSVDMQSFVRQPRGPEGEVTFGDVPGKRDIAGLMRRVKADVVEAKILCGTDDLEQAAIQFESYGCPEVMITRADGVLVRAYGRTVFEKFSNRSVAGRTGRGDTTFAGYLARRLSAGVAESTKFAAALVSIKMETPGPFRGSIDDVLARMKASHQ